MKNNKKAKKKKEATRIKGTSHSHELESYTGTYQHPGYGKLTVHEKEEKLHFTYHDIKTPLEHWHYDVFNGLKGEDPVFQDMKLQFNSNLNGYIAEVKIPMEPSVEPIVFEKKPDERLYDETYLERFTGKYTMAGDTLKVSLAGNQLKIKVPGQPQYTLVPALGFQFKLKEYSIIGISFTINDEGYPTELIFDQPGGRYEAKRVEQ